MSQTSEVAARREELSRANGQFTGPCPAALLRLVQRPGKDGKGAGRALKQEEVISWREYPDRVVVVTEDGQKLTGQKAG